jgi:hypothetical protein
VVRAEERLFAPRFAFRKNDDFIREKLKLTLFFRSRPLY